MTSEDSVERIFTFSFPTCTTNQLYKLEVPIYIPYSGSAAELVQRLISSFRLPCYVEKDLLSELDKFIKIETVKYHDDIAEDCINKAKSGDIDIDALIDSWEKTFKEENVEYADPKGATDEELFSQVYHQLVHSPALETILQVEQSYALAVRELLIQRDEELSVHTTSQTEEMAHAVEGINTYSTEAEINDLAARHFEEQNLLRAKWNSELDTLQNSQKREYREWLVNMFEDHHTNITLPGASSFPRVSAGSNHQEPPSAPRLEESFTIHLGSQMKLMHNIRILSADVLDFCRVRLQHLGNLDPQPQRLQTALGLYSNDLCGLVLLVDCHVGSYSGITKELNEVCQQSTEFHFPTMEDQLEKIRLNVKQAVEWRQSHTECGGGHENIHIENQLRRSGVSKTLHTGDVYITRHSNLAEVHVIFHMVIDDSWISNDMNSRHPAILGLRNILKTACSNDITTLTLPLLLTHEMTEEMTLAWCTKRAELVFKCVKGFMIEMTSWGGSELKNLQFLVPKGISEDVFGVLATMLPSIFTVSNPLVFKASSTPHTPKSS